MSAARRLPTPFGVTFFESAPPPILRRSITPLLGVRLGDERRHFPWASRIVDGDEREVARRVRVSLVWVTRVLVHLEEGRSGLGAVSHWDPLPRRIQDCACRDPKGICSRSARYG